MKSEWLRHKGVQLQYEDSFTVIQQMAHFLRILSQHMLQNNITSGCFQPSNPKQYWKHQ